jgi:CarD family transcriptional regulator
MVHFSCGDRIVYPGHGVAIIDRIVEKIIVGNVMQFFELRFLNKDMTILVPINNAIDVGIRHLSSSEDINNIFKKIAQPATLKQNDIVVTNWNKRNKEYQGKLRTGDLSEICSIYRDLRHTEYYKELSFGEKSLLQQTELLIVEEIAIVNNMETVSAAERLRSIVGCKNKPSEGAIKG